MKVSFVVAVADNDVIGRTDGSIPWRLRTDIRRYRELTMGHPIVMGRKTYESIGKPLPGRLNIVMTRNATFGAEGCAVVHDAKAALEVAEQNGADETFVIGGGVIYDAMMPHADTIYLTRVHASPEGEAHFRFDESEWKVVETEEHPANPETEDEYAFSYIELKRANR